MARIMSGQADTQVKALQRALEAYEQQHTGATASLYRQNPGSVRIRIIDERFTPMPRSQRHGEVWQFLSANVPEDVMGEVSTLILLPASEVQSSLANLEFEDPLPSQL